MQQSYPCEQCGATLEFQPGTRGLLCPYCGYAQLIVGKDKSFANNKRYRNREVASADYVATLQKLGGESPQTTRLSIKCTSCAAEFDFDANLHSDQCPFCGQEIVSEAHEHRSIKPWGILPFAVTENEATIAFNRWLGKLLFAPNKLRRFARSDYRLKGLYVPYWSYNCATDSRYVGQRGDTYQVPVRVRVQVDGQWVTQTKMQTRIRWSPVRGKVKRNFENVLVYASHSLSADMARELAPWDMDKVETYRPEYLAGFQSELYSINLEDGFSVAKYRMDKAIAQLVRFDIGGDFQRVDVLDSSYNDIGFRHILMPFWVAGFTYRNESYQFVVNGRTGEVQGERPYSWVKIALLVLSVLLIPIAIFYLM